MNFFRVLLPFAVHLFHAVVPAALVPPLLLAFGAGLACKITFLASRTRISCSIFCALSGEELRLRY